MDSLNFASSEELKVNEKDNGDENGVVEEVHVEELEEEEKIGVERVDEMRLSRTGRRTGLVNGKGLVIDFESQPYHRKSVRHENLSLLRTKSSSLEPQNTETSSRLQYMQSTSGLNENSGMSYGSSQVSRDSKFSQSKTQIFSDTLRMKEQLQITKQLVVNLSETMQAKNKVISGEFNDYHSAISELSSPNKRLDSAVDTLKEVLTVSDHLDCVTPSSESELCCPPCKTDSHRLPGCLEGGQQYEKKISEGQTSFQDRDGMTAKPGFHVKPVLLNYDSFKPGRCHAMPVETTLGSQSGNASCLLTSEIEEKVSKSSVGYALKLLNEKIKAMNSK